jgi:8-oxo-dGTP pyrophosphatase MutT (NUDIX family)
MIGAAALLVRDARGEVMVVRTTYKELCDLPGESPRQRAEREATEELGLAIPAGRLLVASHSAAHSQVPSVMMHFIFEGPRLEELDVGSIRLGPDEIAEYIFIDPKGVEKLVGPGLGPKILAAATAATKATTTYMEFDASHVFTIDPS